MNIPVLVLDKLFSCHRRRKNSCKYSLSSNTCLILWKRKRNDNSLQEMLFIHIIPHLWGEKNGLGSKHQGFFFPSLFVYFETFFLSWFCWDFHEGIVKRTKNYSKCIILRILSSWLCDLFLAQGYRGHSNIFGGSQTHALVLFIIKIKKTTWLQAIRKEFLDLSGLLDMLIHNSPKKGAVLTAFVH